jgi:hypothetical protein
MSKPLIKIGVKSTNYVGVASLGNTVVAAMSGNLNFTTPVPALAAITAQVAIVAAAITAWGPVGNHGSHAQLLDLRLQTKLLYLLLVQEANYVQNTAQGAFPVDYVNQASVIASSGFSVKNSPTPQGLLGAPQDLHIRTGFNVDPHIPSLKWTKPLNVISAGNVKAYNVYRRLNTGPGAWSLVGTVTKTSFLNTDNLPGVTYDYNVVAINNAGAGTPSAILTYSVPV